MRSMFDDIRLMAGLLALLWLILIVDIGLFGGRLYVFGIVPRTLDGLIGIPLAPFLHANTRHLMANSGPFFVLGLMVLRQGRAVFWSASAVIVLLGGFGTWCIGPAHSVHIGASSLIFGWFGFVLASAWRTPRLSSVALAILAILWYGLGVVFGLSPLQYGVSWQGHLTGLLAGLCAAGMTPLVGRRPLPTVRRRN
jgi:membrane associated rhomboid family serine protease